jgi:hypothetical protein
LFLNHIRQWFYPRPDSIPRREYKKSDYPYGNEDYSEYFNYGFLFLHLRLHFQCLVKSTYNLQNHIGRP